MNPAELDRLARRVNLPIPAEETPMTDTAAARPWDTANNEVTPVRPLRSIAELRPVVDGAIEMLDGARPAGDEARVALAGELAEHLITREALYEGTASSVGLAGLAVRLAHVVVRAGWAPPGGALAEWCCPSCGATTRARMADCAPQVVPGDAAPETVPDFAAAVAAEQARRTTRDGDAL